MKTEGDLYLHLFNVILKVIFLLLILFCVQVVCLFVFFDCLFVCLFVFCHVFFVLLFLA